jgi:hypothetical protein
MNSRAMTGIAALASGGSVTASAQANRAGLYAFHSAHVGECSLLDWHINVAPTGEIVGAVGFDGRRVRLEGTMQKDATFQLAGREMASGRPVTVNGAVERNKLTMTIVGSGGPCDGKMVKLGRLADGGAN